MPQVQTPDGAIVDMPDELTPELAARLKALQASTQKDAMPDVPVPGKPTYTNTPKAPEPSILDRVKSAIVNTPQRVVGNVESLAALGSAVPAQVIGGVAGLAQGLTHGYGTQQGAEAARQTAENVSNKFTYEPKTQEGKDQIQTVAKVMDAAKLPPVMPEVMPALQGKLGSVKSIEDANLAKQSALNIQKGENSVLNATRAAAEKHDFIPTTEGSGLKSMITGVVGKSRVDKWISAHNESIATKKLGEDLGFMPGTPLSKENLLASKKQQYDVFNEMKNIGPLDTKLSDYKPALQKSLNEIESNIKSSPTLYAPHRQSAALLREFLKKDTISSEQALKDIRTLREQAKNTFNNPNRTEIEISSATAKLGIANQLESVFEANLAKAGNNDLLDRFHAARVQLSKIGVAERVVNEGTGKPSLQKLARLSDEYKYTDNLKVMSDFAKAFPEVSQANRSLPTLSVYDGLFEMGAIIGAHPVAGLGVVGTRLVVPRLAAKGVFKSGEPNYQIGATRQALPSAIPQVAGTAAMMSPETARELDRQRRKKERAR